jgi:hypothetical protein
MSIAPRHNHLFTVKTTSKKAAYFTQNDNFRFGERGIFFAQTGFFAG